MNKTIYISGWHSDSNPSPGLGVARSIHDVWTDIEIVAVDYSSRSTGLYDSVVSRRMILPKWDMVDPSMLMRELIDKVIADDALFISGLDLETHQLSGLVEVGAEGKILVPNRKALSLASKPAKHAAELLGLKIPRTVCNCSSLEARRFALRYGWPVQVKGPRYESVTVRNESELARASSYIEKTWDEKPIYQENIEGTEHSIAFAAFDGNLLGACKMVKTMRTSLGKAWCGCVSTLDARQVAALSHFLSIAGWTGGGEIEMIRDADGCDYVIDVNPRFPAWIYGASVNGINLPAALFAHVAGRSYALPTFAKGDYVREVIEAKAPPAYTSYGSAMEDRKTTKGHPSGMIELSRCRHEKSGGMGNREGLLPLSACPELGLSALRLDNIMAGVGDRPLRYIDEEAVLGTTKSVVEVVDTISESVERPIQIRYSIKTNSNQKIIDVIRELGLGAECISLSEVRYASKSGFKGIILNGPGKWWPAHLIESCDAPDVVNCDSPFDAQVTFETIRKKCWSNTAIGFRVSPLTVSSRFGFDVTKPKAFFELCECLRGAPSCELGIHFHFASSLLGPNAWINEAKKVLRLASGAFLVAGRECGFVDFGGGWRVDGSRTFREMLLDVAEHAVEIFPALKRIIIEPGKMLVENGTFLACRVIGIRKEGEATNAVVSAAISDMPDCFSYPHRVFYRKKRGSEWRLIGRGNGKILGRICMESDILASEIDIPDDIECGDCIVFSEVGAYDSSMAYVFGMGHE